MAKLVSTWVAVMAVGCALTAGALPACNKKQEKGSASQSAQQAPARQTSQPQEQARPQPARPTGDATAAEQQAKGQEPRPSEQAKSTEALPKGAVQARMILIGWKGAREGVRRTKEQARALADKVYQEAQKGDFAALAKKYSDAPNKDVGGLLPPVTKKDATKVFQPVFDLKPGQVSKPVEGPDGYYIFKREK